MNAEALAPKLGILAGGGEAPRRLAALLKQAGRPYFLVCLQGQADEDLGAGHPHIWLPLGAGERALKAVRAEGVRDILMIGRVRRPSLLELKPDFFTMQKVMQIGLAMLGDDGLLKNITRVIEDEGFRVVGVQDVFAAFLTPGGVLGKAQPTAQDWEDIKRGAAAARQLGLADVGQAVMVQQGVVLGVEAIEGTDALIARCAGLKRPGGNGVLVKMCKPQQDRRFDLPAIGLETIRLLQAAGFAGVAAEAGASLLLERGAMLAAADAAGLFVAGYEEAGA